MEANFAPKKLWFLEFLLGILITALANFILALTIGISPWVYFNSGHLFLGLCVWRWVATGRWNSIHTGSFVFCYGVGTALQKLWINPNISAQAFILVVCALLFFFPYLIYLIIEKREEESSEIA